MDPEFRHPFVLVRKRAPSIPEGETDKTDPNITEFLEFLGSKFDYEGGDIPTG